MVRVVDQMAGGLVVLRDTRRFFAVLWWAVAHWLVHALGLYLGFLALVSVSLGVLNLLPLPMLDGGHLMYYLYEAFTGRPPSIAWLEAMQRGGLVILLSLMVFSFFK